MKMLGTHETRMLKNDALDRQMVEDGYIVLPFLDKAEVQEFRTLYSKWHPNPPEAFYKSYFDPRIEYKEEVENMVIRCFEEKMGSYFYNYHAFGGLFVVKPPTQEGHLPIHQDWSFVDETKYWSINMWCPLEDVNDANGNLVLLKGSHRFMETVRGSNTPDVYRDHWKLIEQNTMSIPMKAGEAIFFFHGLLHGSTHNTSEEERRCLGLTLTPKEAPLYFYYLTKMDEGNRLERFQTDPEFYIHYASHRTLRPEMEGKSMSFEFPKITEKELYERIVGVLGKDSKPPKQSHHKPTTHTDPWWKTIKRKIADYARI